MAQDPNKVKAATKLQSKHRQRAAAKTTTMMKDPAKQVAAKKLQAAQRGREGRAIAKRKRQQKQQIQRSESAMVLQVCAWYVSEAD